MPLNISIPLGPLHYNKRLDGKGSKSFLYWTLVAFWWLPIKWTTFALVWLTLVTFRLIRALITKDSK